jgi:hypothetical protein
MPGRRAHPRAQADAMVLDLMLPGQNGLTVCLVSPTRALRCESSRDVEGAFALRIRTGSIEQTARYLDIGWNALALEHDPIDLYVLRGQIQERTVRQWDRFSSQKRARGPLACSAREK